MMDLPKVGQEVRTACEELLNKVSLQPGKVLVVGCSTSEVLGQKIGSAGSTQVAEMILDQLLDVCREHSLHLAIQCCEHLNRALVVEQETAERFGWDIVAVVPVPHAGGSLAAQAMKDFNHACVVEQVRAQVGLDIGDTFIGMHLQPVAVPVRLGIKNIGGAHLTAAYSRPKLIGGARAVYVLNK